MDSGTSDLAGRFVLTPSRRRGFPWARLVGPGGEVASLASFGFFKVFLFGGQKIRVGDREWRVQGVPWRRFVCPMLVDENGRRLATSVPGISDYSITCRDRAFTLIPAEQRPGRPRRWELIEFGEPVAAVSRNPYEAEVTTAIPLPALIMSFVLATLGVMGDKEVSFTTAWAAPQ